MMLCTKEGRRGGSPSSDFDDKGVGVGIRQKVNLENGVVTLTKTLQLI